MVGISKNERILFDGDSITDALRDRKEKYSLAGYSALIAERLNFLYPFLNIECYNRGVGGNTSGELLNRLSGELEEIKPTFFSLLIGVNDTWRRFDSGKIISEKEYAENIEKILCMVERYTQKIIVLEPFLLDVDPEKRLFREDLYPKIFRLREIARRHRVEFIPLDGIFAEACCRASAKEYSYDGIHPTNAGHALIAEEWLRRVYAANNF